MTTQQPEVRQLVEWLAETDITLLELKGPGATTTVVRDGRTARQHSPAPSAATPACEPVRAGCVGIFLSSHPASPDEPLASAGDRVALGQTLGLLRIGLALLQVRAPRDGQVRCVVPVHGAQVEFGDVLLELE